MERKSTTLLLGVILFISLAMAIPNLVTATVAPTSVGATLPPEGVVCVDVTVDLPGVIPIGDIIFAFDLTGSMGDELAAAKTNAINIMNSLDALIGDARYGVITYMDYVGYYSSCGYGTTYGSSSYGDYPYMLDLPLTDNRALVSATINALSTGSGDDSPQNYTRIFYESYADPAIGYRTGAKKILINIGDALPHDCNINEGVPGMVGTVSYGKDPGRDGILDTPDDLDLQAVLAEMAANNVTLLELHGNTYFGSLAYWSHWTSLTGGALYHLGAPGDIPGAIVELIEEQATEVSLLTMQVATPGFEPWLTSVVPPSYIDLTLPAARMFNICLTVPAGTVPGIYNFVVSALADGASYGDLAVTIEVPTLVTTANLSGTVSAGGAGLLGVPVSLFDDIGGLIGTIYTDAVGYYLFPDLPPGDFTVAIEPPLGFVPVTPASVDITMAGVDQVVDFELTVRQTGAIQNIGWWRQQVSWLTNGHPENSYYTIEEFEALAALIYEHFYLRADGFAIQIPGVTSDGTGGVMDFGELRGYLLSVPEPHDFIHKSKQFLLVSLLNITSGRLLQTRLVSADGATASQAITHLTALLLSGVSENIVFAYYDLWRLQLPAVIPAGHIPLSTPNVMYRPDDGLAETPSKFVLSQNYPNPFNARTVIEYALPEPAHVRLEVYNMQGQKVATLVDESQEAGPRAVEWNASDVTSGMYFYRLQTGDVSQTNRMILLK